MSAAQILILCLSIYTVGFLSSWYLIMQWYCQDWLSQFGHLDDHAIRWHFWWSLWGSLLIWYVIVPIGFFEFKILPLLRVRRNRRGGRLIERVARRTVLRDIG